MNNWKKINIGKEDNDQTIITFLKRKLSVPLSLIHKTLRKKKILINNNPVRYYHYRIKKQDEILIRDSKVFLSIKEEEKQIPQTNNINFSVIYEDDNFLIVLKDHNVEIHNSLNPKICLNNSVSKYLWDNEIEYNTSSVHRIDKLAKGLVIYPKGIEAKRELHKIMKSQNSIIKNYLAICNLGKRNIPEIIEGFIYKDNERMVFTKEYKDGYKKCSMKCKLIRKKTNIALLEIELITGRKHQIRASLAYFGCAVIGDKKYGDKYRNDYKAIMLFAYKLNFKNISGKLQYLNNKTFEIENMKAKMERTIERW